jgi:hypothetical protein
MKAKTYRSSDFLGPQNLSSFGIEIAPKLTLGLEEFNFIDILKENKLAFVPAFSTRIRQDVDFLELFYYDKQNKTNVKYAELKGIQQIANDEVISIRKMLRDDFMNQVLANERWENVFGVNTEIAKNSWKKYYNTDTVFPKKRDVFRFVLNVRYKEINFLFKPTNFINLNFANNLYI